ncbi:hypothetical protein GALMADRAFT_243536 [Galerina marginata CBS 339.88]|uniref:Uncharacterized protein n=1 Tax=Galerina marginata (strain CBS 339.88) TaxID=685588 RepID=A0A067T8G4_GALM3|nr:hypothetical protein GALMADRAFT_243536 [Galerina marginata CBS 339.88]
MNTLDLQSLRALRNLTLTADMMPEGSYSLDRFSWLVSTLQSCPHPNRIEVISIIIGTRNIDAVKSQQWNRLAAIFGPNIKEKWPKLACLYVDVNNENEADLRNYKEGSLDVVVRPRMRLFDTNTLKIRVHGERLGFWNM